MLVRTGEGERPVPRLREQSLRAQLGEEGARLEWAAAAQMDLYADL